MSWKSWGRVREVKGLFWGGILLLVAFEEGGCHWFWGLMHYYILMFWKGPPVLYPSQYPQTLLCASIITSHSRLWTYPCHPSLSTLVSGAQLSKHFQFAFIPVLHPHIFIQIASSWTLFYAASRFQLKFWFVGIFFVKFLLPNFPPFPLWQPKLHLNELNYCTLQKMDVFIIPSSKSVKKQILVSLSRLKCELIFHRKKLGKIQVEEFEVDTFRGKMEENESSSSALMVSETKNWLFQLAELKEKRN